jgi:hypothetical protein
VERQGGCSEGNTSVDAALQIQALRAILYCWRPKKILSAALRTRVPGACEGARGCRGPMRSAGGGCLIWLGLRQAAGAVCRVACQAALIGARPPSTFLVSRGIRNIPCAALPASTCANPPPAPTPHPPSSTHHSVSVDRIHAFRHFHSLTCHLTTSR